MKEHRNLIIAVIAIVAVISIITYASANQASIAPTADTNIDSPTSAIPTETEINDLTQQLISSSATIAVPDQIGINVSITGKTTEFGDFKNNPTEPYGTVTLGNQAVEIDGNIYTTIAINSGGSGEFVYLAVFTPTGSSYEMDSSVPLGDRVDVDTIIANGDKITITYKVHGPDQALAQDPNIIKTENYQFINGQLLLVQ